MAIERYTPQQLGVDPVIAGKPQAERVIPDLKGLPPLTLTLQELQVVLGPLTLGYKWGEDAIHDLWKLGAPTPQSFKPGAPERRVVFPGQLGKWLADVLARQGRPLDQAAAIYAGLKALSY